MLTLNWAFANLERRWLLLEKELEANAELARTTDVDLMAYDSGIIVRTDDPTLKESVRSLWADPRYYQFPRIAEQWRAVGGGVYVMNYYTALPGLGPVGVNHWAPYDDSVWLVILQSIHNKKIDYE